MGNCLFGGSGNENEKLVHVITCNGGMMEFQPPITAGCILKEFSNQAIYRGDHLLAEDEELQAGERYYLLSAASAESSGTGCHVRSKSIPASSSYRMSIEDNGQSQTLKRSQTEVFWRSNNSKQDAEIWKVRLVISPEQLTEILSQEAQTQELIQSVRTVAKCGHYSGVGFANADYWSTTASSN